MDFAQATKGGRRSEELRYDSVVAVNPGKYEVVLAGQDGETKAKSDLVALNRESYVVLRTGVEAQRGQSFPQELVVFPQSPADSLEKPLAVHPSAAFFLVLAGLFLLSP